MAQRITVTDILSDVRSQLDESNVEAVTDDRDLLPALNRAQNYAVDILARKYKEPLLKNKAIPTTVSVDLYQIPVDALEARVLQVEVNQNLSYFKVQYISYMDASVYEIQSGKSAIPLYYTIVGNYIKLFPASSGAYPLRVWYLAEPAPLAKDQGRVNVVNVAGNYLYVDTVGTDLSTESDQLASFVNLVDGNDGTIKATMQIQSIVGNKITFKTTPTRTTVMDLTIDTAIPTTVEIDDYIVLAPNTCIPFFKKPITNFLVEYTTEEMVRKLGGDVQVEERALAKFERQVEETWVARPNSFRVKKRNKNWARPIKRIGII